MRPFLLMSGEASVTTILAFSNPKWDHVSTPTRLVESEYSLNHIRRVNRPREVISGVIHYCDVSNKDIEKSNLNLLKNKNIPCWPNPSTLLRMIDRHSVLYECKDAGFIDHNIFQSDKFDNQIPYPFVLKTGSEHRGLGKYLIKSIHDIPDWDGIATMEPYFEGTSVRVLIVNDLVFGMRVDNAQSWIKNSPGAEISKIELSNEIINHAKSVTRFFDLEVAGVDYIQEDDGTFHFLEINQYPGFSWFDDTEEAGKALFKQKMSEIEANFEVYDYE